MVDVRVGCGWWWVMWVLGVASPLPANFLHTLLRHNIAKVLAGDRKIWREIGLPPNQPILPITTIVRITTTATITISNSP